MTDTTPRAGAPLLGANQAQKNVTHNEALYQFDALLCARFLDRDLTAPPASPADGDTYLIKATATGAWTGQGGNIAYCADGAWRFYPPFAGLVAYVADELVLVVFNGTAWVDYGTLIALDNVAMLGVNTTANSTNKLAVQSNAALFTDVPTGAGGSGDIRVAISKQAAPNTASLLFQDGFSGRAEIGLTGDDDFHFKVSPDGSSWYGGLKIANGSGLMTVIGDPATALGVATKQYADGSRMVHAVRLAAGANVNVSNPATATFDGATAANGDVIGLFGQTTTAQNGPWVFNGSAVAMTRPAWWATGYVGCGARLEVQEGTAFGGACWRLLTANPIVVDTTSAAFGAGARFASGAASYGPNGATNPALKLDWSTTSAATGLGITAKAAASGLALSTLSSGTNENLAMDAKGSGTITLGGTSTGNIVLSRPSVFSAGGSECARFGSDGSLLLGTTTNGGWTGTAKMESKANGGYAVSAWQPVSSGNAILSRVDNTSAYLAVFYYQTTYVGGVSTSGTAVTYGTSSGEFLPDGTRNKDKIAALPSNLAWDVLEALGPSTYQFVTTGQTGHGFVVEHMHERLTAQGHDLTHMGLYTPVSAEHPGAVDYGKATPFLTAALLDMRNVVETQIQTIETLQSECAALRGRIDNLADVRRA